MPVKRKRDKSLVYYVAITLIPGRDDDLIAAINSAPAKQIASTVREMMRNGARGQAKFVDVDAGGELELTGAGFDL